MTFSHFCENNQQKRNTWIRHEPCNFTISWHNIIHSLEKKSVWCSEKTSVWWSEKRSGWSFVESTTYTTGNVSMIFFLCSTLHVDFWPFDRVVRMWLWYVLLTNLLMWTKCFTDILIKLSEFICTNPIICNTRDRVLAASSVTEKILQFGRGWVMGPHSS